MATALGIPTALIDTLASTWQALSDLGAGLTEAQWKTPTDLPGWSVQDTLAHVIGVERVLQGLPPAAPLHGPMPGHVRNPIGEFNEQEIAARRALTGAEVLAEWNDLQALRRKTLAEAGPEYFAQEMATPTGPGTMTDFLASRIVDCWVHEQDIRRAVAIPGNLDSAGAEHTIDRLLRSMPMVVGKRAACPEGDAVELELTEPIARRLVYEVQEGRASVVETSAAPPRATVVMDTETFVVLAAGRGDVTAVAERVTTTGDSDLAGRVVASLNVLF